MGKPGASERAIGLFVGGQFFDDLHLGTRMRQGVDEIVHDEGKVVMEVVEYLGFELLCLLDIGDFDVLDFDGFAEDAFD